MTANDNLIAIGRSRYLYDAIRRLADKGYPFKAIVTEEAYDEYDVKHADFERLAAELGCAFFMTKDVNVEPIRAFVAQHDVRVAISANWKYTIAASFLDLFECGPTTRATPRSTGRSSTASRMSTATSTGWRRCWTRAT
jgi:methionyl-tRNA formyltransferase